MTALPYRRLALLPLLLFSLLAAGAARAESILFVGNSFTYGAGSPVWKYRSETVTDLNAEGVGGVPALFKAFAEQAGLDYQVSLETAGGTDIAFHLRERRARIDRAWDHVVLQSYSTLDKDRPGDPASLVASARQAAAMFAGRNPKVSLWLTATWSRADQVWKPGGAWHGKPIAAMALDVRRGYDRARAVSPLFKGVIPAGEAWNRAFAAGVADPNPYDGLTFGQVDLWTHDQYHASAYGYYLEALVAFGRITGRDPRSLGQGERSAAELGFSTAQTEALQRIAAEELAAEAARR
jgi:hypothetical protein